MNLIQTGSTIIVGPFNLQLNVNYTGVLTTFVFPAGLTYVSSTVNAGTVNVAGTQWTIASYVKDFNAQITFTFTVADAAVFGALADADRKVTGDTTDLTGEVSLLDNVAVKFIQGITCVDVNECIGTQLAGLTQAQTDIVALQAFDAALVVPVISDIAYNATTWDGNLDGASKNAIRDILQTIIAGVTPDGDKGDVTVSAAGTVWTVDNNAITYPKIQDISLTDRLLGRDTVGAGDIEELTVSNGIEFTGLGGIQRSALTGDVTAAAGNNVTTLSNNVVSNAKLADMATDSLIGRDTAGSGDPEYITLDDTLEFDGLGKIQRAALGGDVTASAGSNITLIPNDTVTYAKIQNVSATDRVLGRSTAGAGDIEEIVFTASMRQLADDASFVAMRTTLGLTPGVDVQEYSAFLSDLVLSPPAGFISKAGGTNAEIRVLTGTVNEITITNGDGIAGNPVFSLPTTIDLSGKTSLAIPTGAAPIVNSNGEIALDTTIVDMSHGLIKYFSTEELAIIAIPVGELTGMNDGDVIKYNATADEFQLAAEAAEVIPTLQQVLDAGSTLTSSEIISTGAFTLSVNTATAATNPLSVNSTTGNTISAVATTGNALYAINSGANAVISAAKVVAATNAVQAMVSLSSQTSGVAANGLGAALDFYLEDDLGANPNSTRLKSVVTNAAAASFTTRFAIETQNATVLAEKLSIAGNGKLSLPEYGGGTFTGTATYSLQVDVNGEVIEDVQPKVYKAIIAQAGVAAPTATVIHKNTLGGVPVLARTGVGVYTLTLVGAFLLNKVFPQISKASSHATANIGYIASLYRTSDDVMTFETVDAAGALDDIDGSVSILIEVYPV